MLTLALGGCVQSTAGEITFPEERETPTGTLEVFVSTMGANPDPDGYVVILDEARSQSVDANGTVTFAALLPGGYQVLLSDLDGSCTVPAGASQAVNVMSGTTSSASFVVDCP